MQLGWATSSDIFMSVHVGTSFGFLVNFPFKLFQGCAYLCLSPLFIPHVLVAGTFLYCLILLTSSPDLVANEGSCLFFGKTISNYFFRSWKFNHKCIGGEFLKSNKTHWFATFGRPLYPGELMYSKAHQVGAHWDRLHKNCSLPVVIHRLFSLWKAKDRLIYHKINHEKDKQMTTPSPIPYSKVHFQSSGVRW